MKERNHQTHFMQAVCLTLCLALGLAGCGARSSTALSSPAPSLETDAPATPDTAPQEVRMLTSGAFHAAAGEDGFYLPQVYGDGVLGTVVDFSTGEQRVLCTLPGCTHHSSSCGAWLRSAGDLGAQTADSCALIPAGDSLFWLAFEDPVGEQPSYIDVSSPDGSGRTRLSDHLSLLCPAWSNWPNGFFSDGESFYFLTSQDGADAFLSRMNLQTGALTVTELPGGSPGAMIGTDGGSVLFWQEAADGSRHLLALDLAAARLEERDSWLPGREVLGVTARGGTLWAAVRQEDTLLLQAGPAEGDPETIVPLPDRSADGLAVSSVSLTGPFEQYLMADLHFPNAEDGGSTPALRCGVDLDTGSCRTLESTWQTGAEPEPPLVLGAGEDALWLAVAHSPAGSLVVDSGGIPSRQEISTARTVLTHPADYLTGSGETRPVTMLTGEFTAHIPH